MKTIRAYSCVRDSGQNRSGQIRPGKTGGSVCFVLDEAHAVHTLRTFLRGQGASAVLEPMSDAETSRLLGTGSNDEAPTPDKPVS